MAKVEAGVGAAVIGLATFSLWQTWQGAAPSLKELRETAGDSQAMRTQLMDADIVVGSLTILVAISLAWYTGDKAALILLLASFGILSLWSHMVLNSESLIPER